jgi:hypothetical protein
MVGTEYAIRLEYCRSREAFIPLKQR